MSYTTFLLVEDGSADAEELISDLKERNPEIKVIVYRQGAQPPEMMKVKEKRRRKRETYRNI